MLPTARTITALTGSIAISGCLFFMLALVFPSTSDTPFSMVIDSQIRSYLFDFSHPLLIGHPELNVNEERHLLDVKRILQKASWGMLFLITLATAGLLLLPQPKVTKYIGITGLAFLTLLTIIISIAGFRSSFVWLHSWLFLPESWWFSEESTLIQLFPLEFFQNFTMIYTTSLTLVFVACWWISRNSPEDQPGYTENQQPNNQSASKTH